MEPDSQAYSRYRREAGTRSPAAPSRPWLTAGAAIACAILVTVGSFGPWLRVRERGGTTGTVSGLETDGLLTLVAGVVALLALVVVLARPEAGIAAWVGLLALGFSALVGAADWFILGPTAGAGGIVRVGAVAGVGWGLVVVTLAGAIGAVGAFHAARQVSDV